MKRNNVLSQVINAVISNEKNKAKTRKPDYFLNQKKQLWYGLMNRVDDDTADRDHPEKT